MTIAEMIPQEMAERMGSDATEAESEKFRELLIEAGYEQSESDDIPESTWLRIMDRAIIAMVQS